MWEIFALILGLTLSTSGEAPLQSNYIPYPPNTSQNLQQGYNYVAPTVEVNTAKQNQPSLKFTQPTSASQSQRSSSGYHYDTPSQSYQEERHYQQPLQQYRQPVQQYKQPLQQYQQPLQQYQQPLQQYQHPIQQYQQPNQQQQPIQQYQAPQSLYQQPITPNPTQQSILGTPESQTTQDNNGYNYHIPQQSFNSQSQNSFVSLQSTNSLSNDAEVIEPFAQQKQVSPLTLDRYQQPSNSQNYQLSLQSGNALDFDLMNQVASLIQEHENSYARSSYQKVAGVTLDQPSKSIEVSSFVQNAPLSNQLVYSNEAQRVGAQNHFGVQESSYPQQTGINSQENHQVLPEVIANRQIQTTVSSPQTSAYLDQSRLTQGYNYPQPARIHTQNSQSSLPELAANRQVSNAPTADSHIYSNQNQYSGYNYPKPTENNEFTLPEVIANRQAQSSSIGVQAQSGNHQYTQSSRISAPNNQYGLPEVVANRQVQSAPAEIASARSVQAPSSGYSYPQSSSSRQVQSTPAEVVSARSVQEPSSGYSYPQSVNSNLQVQNTPAGIASARSIQEPSSGYSYPQSVNSKLQVQSAPAGIASARTVQEASPGYSYPVNSNQSELAEVVENSNQVSSASASSSASSSSTHTQSDAATQYNFVPRVNQPISSYGVPN